MDLRPASAATPALSTDPARDLVIQPRERGQASAPGRLFGLLTSAVLHAGLLSVVLLGGGVALQSGHGQAAEAALETRVQLRFVSAGVLSGGQTTAADKPDKQTSSQLVSLERQSTNKASFRVVEASPVPVATEIAEPAVPSHTNAPGTAAAEVGQPQLNDKPVAAASRLSQNLTEGRHHGHHRGRKGEVMAQGGDAHSSAQAAAGGGEAEADWAREVMRRLEKFRSYPAAARHRRAEGVVLVQATIDADGRVLATHLRSSCGNADLDAEALATFARARTLPAPPSHLPMPLRVDLPVAFALRS